MADADRIAITSLDASGLRVSRNRLQQIGPSFLMQWPGCPRNESTAVFQCECGSHEAYKVRDVYRGHAAQCLVCNWQRITLRPSRKKRPIHTHRAGGSKITGQKAPHPEYWIWSGIRARCCNPRTSSYKHYGARGIAICDRWRDNFAAFIEDMGDRPSPDHTIDRIDPDGNYDPENCRWALPDVQANNKRNSRTVNGKTLGQLSVETGISVDTLRSRLNRGWTLEKILATPVE